MVTFAGAHHHKADDPSQQLFLDGLSVFMDHANAHGGLRLGDGVGYVNVSYTALDYTKIWQLSAHYGALCVDPAVTVLIAPFASACVAFSARTPEAVKRAVERALREKGLSRPRGIGGDGDDETAGEEDDGPGARAGRARRTTPAVRTIDSASRRETWRGSSCENDAFAGAMAWADGVLVTADSCSMLSEAASLGVPVFVARFEHAKGKMSKFLAALATRGACVDAAAVFPNAPSRREADAAAERLASFVRYRRSVVRDQPSSLARDLETAAARVRELVEVRAGGRKKARV